MRNNIIETLFLLIVGTLFSASLIIGIISTTEFNYSVFSIISNIFLTLVLFRIIFFNKYTFLVFALISLISAGLIFREYITAYEYYVYDTTFYVLRDLSERVLLYLTGLISYQPEFEFIITWILILSISFLVYVFGFAIFNFFILFAFGMILYATILVSPFFDFYLAFYLFIASSTAFLVKYLNSRTLKNKSPFSLYTIPIAALAMFIAINIPTPREGFAADTAENVLVRPFNFINDTLQDTFRPMYFSLSQTGFGSGDARRLGGNVRPNYNIVMRVRSDREVVYLTGAILNEYTGYSWVNTFSAYETTNLMQNGESLINRDEPIERLNSLHILYLSSYYNSIDFIDNFTSKDVYYLEMDYGIVVDVITRDLIARPYFNISTLYVDTHNHSTRSIFYDGIIIGYSAEEFDILVNKNGTLTSNERVPRGAIYTIEHIDLVHINTSAILPLSYSGILRDVLYYLENIEYEGLFHPISLSLKHNIQTYLIPRRDFINGTFLQIPDHFPQRVIDLAKYLTYDATSDYERARILESYLRRFPYTLEPGNLPHGVDFVEHFLFYLQKGYCVHYATAFVMMARALGMPTRYVEGFIAAGMGDEFFYVRNRQGHAWAEVYFEGFGWYRFDPTPPSETFGVIFSSPETFAASQGNLPLNTEEFEALLSNFWGESGMFAQWEEEYFFDSEEGISSPNLANLVGGSGDELSTTTEEIENVQIPVNVLGIIFLAFLILLSILAFLIISKISLVVLRHYKNVKKSNNESVIYLFGQIIERLKFFGYEINDDETAQIFAQRVGKRFGFEESAIYLTDIALIYQKAMYSPHEITNEEKRIVKEALKTVETDVKKYTSKSKYYIYKYVL